MNRRIADTLLRHFNPRAFSFLVFLAVPAGNLVLAVNLIVDPYRRFDLVSIEGFNAQRPESSISRLGKSGAICRLRPAQVILGTSRVEVGIDPQHPGFADLAGSVYNAALAGSGLHELDLTMRHAVHASPQLKRVLVGLDFLMFNAHREVAAYGTEVRDFDSKRLLHFRISTVATGAFRRCQSAAWPGRSALAFLTVIGQIEKPSRGQNRSCFNLDRDFPTKAASGATSTFWRLHSPP